MISKISIAQKLTQKKETTRSNTILYPLYFMAMGLVFGSILFLSAVSNFLFFGELALTMAVIIGLITIHLIGNQQTKK